MNTRTCTKCGEAFPPTPEYFFRAKSGKFGLQSRCKKCLTATARKWEKENRVTRQKTREKRSHRAQCSIYQIVNMKTERLYVGESAGVIGDRWVHHKSHLRRQKHGNSQLQEDWNKYGEEAFIFEIIEELSCDTSKDVLLKKEKEYIKQYLKEGKVLYNKQSVD